MDFQVNEGEKENCLERPQTKKMSIISRLKAIYLDYRSTESILHAKNSWVEYQVHFFLLKKKSKAG